MSETKYTVVNTRTAIPDPDIPDTWTVGKYVDIPQSGPIWNPAEDFDNEEEAKQLAEDLNTGKKFHVFFEETEDHDRWESDCGKYQIQWIRRDGDRISHYALYGTYGPPIELFEDLNEAMNFAVQHANQSLGKGFKL